MDDCLKCGAENEDPETGKFCFACDVDLLCETLEVFGQYRQLDCE